MLFFICSPSSSGPPGDLVRGGARDNWGSNYSPEIEVEKGRSESYEEKHFSKAAKKTDSKKTIGMTFTINI